MPIDDGRKVGSLWGMKFEQFTTEERDGANTYDAKIKLSGITEICVWHDDFGNVGIQVMGRDLALESFPVKGRANTERMARQFVKETFAKLNNLFN